MYEKIIAYYLTAMVAFNVLLFIGADFLLSTFYGGKYPDSVWIFRIFLIFSFFEPLYNLTMGVLYGLGKPVKAFKPLLTGVPLFILCNFVLMTLFSGIGAAITFGLTNLYMSTRLLAGLKDEIGISYLNSLARVRNIPRLLMYIPGLIFKKKNDSMN
jgi:O-antigen/teichoic acid export membrane protein